MSEKLNAYFAKISIAELPQTPLGSVKVLDADMSVSQAVEFLHDNKILSAPVLDKTKPTTASWKEKYIGMFDTLRACVVMTEEMSHKSEAIKEETSSQDEEEQFDGQLRLSAFPGGFDKMPLRQLKEDNPFFFPFLPVEKDATMLDALVLMGNMRLKRLPVVSGPEGDVINLVTQSSIIKFLSKGLATEEFTEIAQQTVEKAGLSKPMPVHTIRRDETVKHAFDLISQKSISAVPVLGLGDRVIATITSSHVYYIISAVNKFRILNTPANQFLQAVEARQASWNIRATAISCRPGETLLEVMKKMDTARIHRIYVVGADDKLLRVLSLCDLLEHFVKDVDNSCTLL